MTTGALGLMIEAPRSCLDQSSLTNFHRDLSSLYTTRNTVRASNTEDTFTISGPPRKRQKISEEGTTSHARNIYKAPADAPTKSVTQEGCTLRPRAHLQSLPSEPSSVPQYWRLFHSPARPITHLQRARLPLHSIKPTIPPPHRPYVAEPPPSAPYYRRHGRLVPY